MVKGKRKLEFVYQYRNRWTCGVDVRVSLHEEDKMRAMTETKAKAKELIEQAGKEFDKDGGLSFTKSVMDRVDRDDIMFNAKHACVKLCVIVRFLLKEYGSLVAQLEEKGIGIVEVGSSTEKNA